MNEKTPSFNLWTDPWINVIRVNDTRDTIGIEQALLESTEVRTLVDVSSPLVVAGQQRLLTAILQDRLNPQADADLRSLWMQRRNGFSAGEVRQFGTEFGDRFDLFSDETPFMQSTDPTLLPPERSPKSDREKMKSVTSLFAEIPSGTEDVFHTHVFQEDVLLCSRCIAAGLTLMPMFATQGGQGYTPSINGAPPIYLLPGGRTLFEVLLMSLVTPKYQQRIGRGTTQPWWKRTSREIREERQTNVSYLHGLTFTPRAVRLYPIPMNEEPCIRCGTMTTWGARYAGWRPGEYTSVRKQDRISLSTGEEVEQLFWQDPFVAYRVEKGQPRALRLTEGWPAWREFAALLVPSAPWDNRDLRPQVLMQLADISDALPYDEDEPLPFKIVAMRSEQAAVSEWLGAGFSVVPKAMRDPTTSAWIDRAVELADTVRSIIATHFAEDVGFGWKKRKKYSDSSDGTPQMDVVIYRRMLAMYWSRLSGPFHQFIAKLRPNQDPLPSVRLWGSIVEATGLDVFQWAVEHSGDDPAQVARAIRAENECKRRLSSALKKYLL
jgi:CRISPR system Cascade subunit CasA